jgi:signal transduction protein with GAF and PtsI domain
MTSTQPIQQTALPYHVSRIVSSDQALDHMLAELVRLIVRVTHCDACLVYLADHATGEVVLRASQLPHDAELGTVRMKLGEGITGWVAERNAVVAIGSNAFKDPRFRRFPALVEDTFEALLSVPIMSEGQVIGVVNVHNRQAHAHAPDEVALVCFVGEQMGGAIARASLREENTRLREETLEARQQLETRKRVERAKGILQIRHRLSEEGAYLRLRNESRRMRRPMGELAEAIILSEEISASNSTGEKPTSEGWRENH